MIHDGQEEQWTDWNPQAKGILQAPAGTPVKAIAAKGALPLPPKDLVWLLAGLSKDDSDQAIATMATGTLAKLPEKILLAALSQPMPGMVADQLAHILPANEGAYQLLVSQRHLSDEALVHLIPKLGPMTLEVVLENQARLLRSNELVLACRAHPAMSPAALDRMIDFLVRSGVILAEIPEFAEALHRLSNADLLQVANGVALPPEASAWLETESELPSAAPQAHGEEGGAQASQPEDESSSSPQDQAEEGQEEPTHERISMQKMIGALSPAQKVALAMKGNREARSILLRDTNRVVATAAIRNPRLTDQEILAAAKNRSINDEVIRIISQNKQMSRSYAVRVALINNPKTPISVAMRYLPGLNQLDLKSLVKSKGVPNALVIAAKRMLMQQKQ